MDDEYEYEIIDNEEDARLCAELVAEQFSQHNPITLFDGISATSFFQNCAWPLMQDVVHEKLSFLARHRASKQIIGTIVACDSYVHHRRHPYDANSAPSVIPVSDLLDEMDDHFISNEFEQELKPNLVLHIVFAAVSSQHGSKGVGSKLNTVICNYVQKEKGFRYAFVQTTNPKTRHIYVDKMGGKELLVVDPTTWAWKKNSAQLLYPYKNYPHGTIPNILIDLKNIKN